MGSPLILSLPSLPQALAAADAVDALKAGGQDTGPLCGLPLSVKDSQDVLGLPTSASTPALIGKAGNCQ